MARLQVIRAVNHQVKVPYDIQRIILRQSLGIGLEFNLRVMLFKPVGG
jgi:hypothetical protein